MSEKPDLLTPEEAESELTCIYCGKPIVKNDKVCRFCGAEIEWTITQTIKDFVTPKKPINIFDALVAILVFAIWFTATGWILSKYRFSSPS
jgi:hypothetical protein